MCLTGPPDPRAPTSDRCWRPRRAISPAPPALQASLGQTPWLGVAQMQSQAHDLSAGWVHGVIMHVQHVGGTETFFRLTIVRATAMSESCRPWTGACAQRNGVKCADRPVIGARAENLALGSSTCGTRSAGTNPCQSSAVAVPGHCLVAPRHPEPTASAPGLLPGPRSRCDPPHRRRRNWPRETANRPEPCQNSRVLRARIMANTPWIVSRLVSHMGTRFKATSGSPGWLKAKCRSHRSQMRFPDSIGAAAPPFTAIVSVRTSIWRHCPFHRYASGCSAAVSSRNKSA